MAALIVQSVAAKVRQGATSMNVVLGAPPTPGNKLIWCHSMRDGPYTVIPSVSGFTAGYLAWEYSRTHASWLYRDVLPGDSATWVSPAISFDQRVFLMEVSGLVAGTATAHGENDGNFGAGVHGSLAVPGPGFMIAHLASEANTSMTGAMTEIDNGWVYEEVNPRCMTGRRYVTTAETVNVETGFTQEFGLVMAYWALKALGRSQSIVVI